MNFAVSTEWFVEDKIILVRIKDNDVDEYDFMAADESICRDFLDRTFSRHLHVIFDHSRIINVPHLRLLPRFTDHPKMGQCVSFGGTTFSDMFGRMTRGKNLESFRSLDDCLNFLLDRDPQLPRRLPKFL